MKKNLSRTSWHQAVGAALPLALLALLLSLSPAGAAGFSDSFETFALGAIESDYTGGPNEALSGGPNPWFGVNPPALVVVNAENGVTPHGGTNMLRGHYNGLYRNDQAWYNLSFRYAAGSTFMGDFVLEWWFYDPLGAGGGGDYIDYVALGNYSSVPADMDYYWGSWPAPSSQRLCLGANAVRLNTDIDATLYQARILGAVDSVNAEGWFNLTNAPRSIGWHQARIVFGAPNWGDTVAKLYIDNMAAPALTHAIMNGDGFNLLEVNADFGNTSGYFDDFVFQDNVAAPYIGTGPANQTVVVGDGTSFSIGGMVPGTPAGAIYWQKDGTPLTNGGRISGVNNSTLTISGVVAADAGTYSCLVSNLAGVFSASATLTVLVPPTIDSQSPAGGTASAGAGDTVTLSVTAHASNPITYRWSKDGSQLSNGGHIAGATTATLVISPFDSSDQGVYSCHLSNAQGVTDSAAVTLVVAAAPSINVQPTNQTVAAGATVTFVVGAAGPGLFYQWSKGSLLLTDGGRISGATTSALRLTGVVAADAGGYFCLITNASGKTPSAIATLTVIDPPIITTQPVSQVASLGGSAIFHVAASGSALTYQWKKNGVALSNGGDFSGVTTADLTVHVTSVADEGVYTVTVSNIGGSPTSPGAALRVNQTVVSFFDDFERYSTSGPIGYGRINGTALDYNHGDNTAASDPWWGASPPNICVYTSGQESVTAHSGNNMVGGAYASVNGSDNDESFLNLVYRFNSGQTYYGNILLDWYFYDNGLTDCSDQLTLANFASRVPATSDSSGFLIPASPVQNLFLGTWPNLDPTKYQVAMMGVADGQAGKLSRNISGTTKYFDTTATRSAGWHHFRIVVGAPDAGTHVANASFFVDDMSTSVFSRDLPAANVGFNALHFVSCSIWTPQTTASAGFWDDVTFQAANDPYIIEQPVGMIITNNSTATFRIVAFATGYQWQKDGMSISGATQSTLTLNAVSLRDEGAYTCVVTGANGSVTSSPAFLVFHWDAPPLLTAKVVGSNVVITWNGSFFLQAAPTATGPFNDITGATSPYTNQPPLAGQRFFRLGL